MATIITFPVILGDASTGNIKAIDPGDATILSTFGISDGTNIVAIVTPGDVPCVPVAMYDSAGNQLDTLTLSTEVAEGTSDPNRGIPMMFRAESNTARIPSETYPLPTKVTDATCWKRISASGLNEENLAGGPYRLRAVHAFNESHLNAYLKLYDLSATPDASTDVPFVTIRIPADGAVSVPFEGLLFEQGIGIAITGGVADNDITDVDADQVVVNITAAQ